MALRHVLTPARNIPEFADDVRSAAPEWLRHQRYARDIVGRIVETRVRALSAETKELADFLAVPC